MGIYGALYMSRFYQLKLSLLPNHCTFFCKTRKYFALCALDMFDVRNAPLLLQGPKTMMTIIIFLMIKSYPTSLTKHTSQDEMLCMYRKHLCVLSLTVILCTTRNLLLHCRKVVLIVKGKKYLPICILCLSKVILCLLKVPYICFCVY